jgi:hypothetical protein
VVNGSIASAYPAKEYDAKDYAQLMRLQSIPTVAQVWAKPSTVHDVSAELLVRIPWRGRSTCTLSAFSTSCFKEVSVSLHASVHGLCVGTPNRKLHMIPYLAAVTWW